MAHEFNIAPALILSESSRGKESQLIPFKRNDAAILPLKARSYEAAKRNRLNSDFNQFNTSIDKDIYAAMLSIRSRARELCQNDPYAKRALRLYQINVVGPYGFRFEIELDNATALEEKDIKVIKASLKDWSRKENCTVTGRLSMRAVERLTLINTARDGEALTRKVKDKRFKYGYALQPLEIDMLDDQYNADLGGGAFVRMGVEFDRYRKPVAYWLRQSTPSQELWGFSVYSADRKRIVAEDINHYFDQERAFQSRGMTWFAQTITRLRNLGKFEEAALYAARGGASKMGFLKKQLSAGEYIGDETGTDGNPVTNFEPGTIEMLPHGYEFQGFDPRFPNDMQGPFTKINLRGVASGTDLNYHDLSNDYETTTYSSGRLASLTEREMWKDHQELFIEHFLDDVYAGFLKEGMFRGAIDVPYAFVEKYINAAVWYGRRWSWIDPLKDVTAKILATRAGFENGSEILAEQGGSWTENLSMLAKNKDAAAKLGLVLSIFDQNPLTADSNLDEGDGKTKKKSKKQDILREVYTLLDLVNRTNGEFEHA